MHSSGSGHACMQLCRRNLDRATYLLAHR
jgi:hypothetical protein